MTLLDFYIIIAVITATLKTYIFITREVDKQIYKQTYRSQKLFIIILTFLVSVILPFTVWYDVLVYIKHKYKRKGAKS